MTLEQFKEALLNAGYKLTAERPNYEAYKKRNKRITVQEYDTHTNIYYDKTFKEGSVELNQHCVIDFVKVLKNITNFERKLGL